MIDEDKSPSGVSLAAVSSNNSNKMTPKRLSPNEFEQGRSRKMIELNDDFNSYQENQEDRRIWSESKAAGFTRDAPSSLS
jgi:hypothetical protein